MEPRSLRDPPYPEKEGAEALKGQGCPGPVTEQQVACGGQRGALHHLSVSWGAGVPPDSAALDHLLPFPRDPSLG